MTMHTTGTREEWMTARFALLNEEKELTRRGDALTSRRQALPWVKIEKDYRFETESGSARLADLFQGRSQLLLYHFMFGPDYKAGCPSCSSIADGFDGIAVHLANHDVTLGAVSRASLDKLTTYKARMGWRFPWASAGGSDFLSDFGVHFTPEHQRDGGIEYNYRKEAPVAVPRHGKSTQDWTLRGSERPVELLAWMTGVDVPAYTRDRPGVSAFILEDGEVYHTYSAYARGLDALWGMYPRLDRTPKGRNEQGVWWGRHDEYAV